ncbi:MAG: hypothetical protein K2K59_04260 [Muribaculaceae bacterium]|nr:hypothetical protein [Muribaculaceae bacterium]
MVTLNISGNVTQTLIKPYFDGHFGVVWFCVCVSLVLCVCTNHYDVAFSELSLSSKVRHVIADIVFLTPSVIWICGYIKVKRWNSIGKYLMCGAIYLMALFWIYSLVFSCIHDAQHLNSILDDYGIIGGFVGLIWGAFLIGSVVYYLFEAVLFIKKGDKLNPAVWKYSGTKTLPILYEIVFPCIYVLFWLILFALNMGGE